MADRINTLNKTSLVFSSSDTSPVAYIGARGIRLERFKLDVSTLVDHLVQNEVRTTLITTKRKYAFSVVLLASWLAEATVILPPDQHESTLERIRRLHQPGFECDKTWCEQLVSSQTSVDEKHGSWTANLEPDLCAALLYTSGSTGKPKLIEKSLENLLSEARCLRDSFDWPMAAIVGTVPAQHLYGLSFSVLLPWVLGVPWVDDVPLFPEDILTTIEQSQARNFIGVPPHYNALIQHQLSRFDLNCVSAAAPLSAEIALQWNEQYQHKILEIYGSTETGVIGYRKQLESPHWKAISPVNLSTKSGLLKVSSPFVSGGTGQEFQTADKVRLMPDHHFDLLGRADAVVKIGGKRVSLRVVEKAIIGCEGVRDAVVLAVAVESTVRAQALWAVVEVQTNGRCSALSLRKALRFKLDGVSIPKRFVLLDELPRNSNGKVIRSELVDLFERKTS